MEHREIQLAGDSLQQAGKNRASHNFEIRYSRFSGLLPFTINDSVA